MRPFALVTNSDAGEPGAITKVFQAVIVQASWPYVARSVIGRSWLLERIKERFYSSVLDAESSGPCFQGCHKRYCATRQLFQPSWPHAWHWVTGRMRAVKMALTMGLLNNWLSPS
jgi:hypothetical protein